MSELRTNKISNIAGVEQYLAKAWVNFNGVGTVAIRAAGNVSSITDNGVGDYTLNFTTPIVDANYAPVYGVTHTTSGGSLNANSQVVTKDGTPPTTTQLRIQCGPPSNSGAADMQAVYVAIFR